MTDDMKKKIEDMARKRLPKPVQDYLNTLYTPAKMHEVVALLDVSATLVETAAYGAAGKTSDKTVIDLFALAAQLETQAKLLGGAQVS